MPPPVQSRDSRILPQSMQSKTHRFIRGRAYNVFVVNEGEAWAGYVRSTLPSDIRRCATAVERLRSNAINR